MPYSTTPYIIDAYRLSSGVLHRSIPHWAQGKLFNNPDGWQFGFQKLDAGVWVLRYSDDTLAWVDALHNIKAPTEVGYSTEPEQKLSTGYKLMRVKEYATDVFHVHQVVFGKCTEGASINEILHIEAHEATVFARVRFLGGTIIDPVGKYVIEIQVQSVLHESSHVTLDIWFPGRTLELSIDLTLLKKVK